MGIVILGGTSTGGPSTPSGVETALDHMYVAGGEETLLRQDCTASSTSGLASGRIFFGFFTARANRTVTGFRIDTGNTAAATITLARLGLYTSNLDGSSLTCVAACAPSTTLGTATFTPYTAAFATNTVGGQAMPTSYALAEGARYAIGGIWVGTTMPTFYGQSNLYNLAASRSPRLAGILNGQTDLVLTATGLADASTLFRWEVRE